MKKKKIPELEGKSQVVFDEFLNQVFAHVRDTNLSYDIWKMHCGVNNGHTPFWLAAFFDIVTCTPSNLDEILRVKGHINLIHDQDLATERDYSDEEVLQWTKEIYRKFAVYFFENQPYQIENYLDV